MAKQYISGVSGLLTEPNPADSPSNTLTEAENVIIDQNGKVQARHGLNIQEQDKTTPVAGSSVPWQIEQVNRKFDENTTTLYGGSFTEHLFDNIMYSSFYENSGIFFKLFELKNSDDDILTGYLVKQPNNQYAPFLSENNYSYNFVIDQGLTDTSYIYYKLNNDTGKIEKAEKINYREITDIFNTKTSTYIQTEDGLAESNVDDLFRPTEDRFFTIQWPAYPVLNYTIVKSDLYENWLKAGQRCGVRFTFYREMGYTDNQTNLEVYESAPSRIYEILNTGEDGIIKLSLDFSAVLDSDDFKRYNLFTRFNNGRKFGIKIYRTATTNLLDDNFKSIPLGDEYFQCYDTIPFDSLFTSSFDLSSVSLYSPLNDKSDKQYWFRFNDYNKNSIYRLASLHGEYNIGDTISYILNDSDLAGNKLYNRYVISNNQKRLTQFTNYESFTKIDENDYVPAKLEIADKTIWKTDIVVSPDDADIDTTNGNISNFNIYNQSINRNEGPVQYTARNTSEYTESIGYILKNTDDFTKYINQANIYVRLRNNVLVSYIDFASNVTITAPNNFLTIIKDGTEYTATLTAGSRSVTQIASEINTQLSSNGIYAYTIEVDGYPNYTKRLFIARVGRIYTSFAQQYTFAIKNVGASSVLFSGTREFPMTETFFSTSYNRVIFRPNAAIKLEIWEYEEKPSGFSISDPYIKLTNRLTSGELVFDQTQYGVSAETVTFDSYIQDPETNIYFNSSSTSNPNRGFDAFIKINLDQDFVFKPGKSYFCTISTKNFAEKEFGFDINPVTYVKPGKNRYNVDIFRTFSPATPKYVQTLDNQYAGLYDTYLGYNIVFSKQVAKYAYKLKALGNIIDSFGQNTTIPIPFIFTGNTNSTTQITTSRNLLPFKIPIGSVIVGNNIPVNTTITAISATSIFISNNATSTATGVSFTIYSHSGTILYTYNPSTMLLNTDEKSLYLSRPTTSTTNPLTSLTANATFDATTDRFTIKNTRLKNGQYIRFVQDFLGAPTPPTGINLNQWYAIQNVIVSESDILQSLETSFDIGITFTTPSTGTLRAQILANEALTDNRYFIRNFNISLELNDDGIISIYNRLYTDKNLDGALHTNLISPNCNVIAPFKDFYIYANTKLPLTASFSVTSLPKTEQISAYLVNIYNGTSINWYDVSPSKFGSLTQTSLNPNDPIKNGPVYVETALFQKPTAITSLTSNVYNTNGKMISVMMSITQTSTNYPFNATLFERPYLTLKLTSINNLVEYITIQTESLYNRNGYYSQVVSEIGEKNTTYDKKYLQFDKTSNEGNSFVPTTTTSVTRRSYLPGMKAGTKDNECEPDFSFTNSTSTWLSNNTSPVYYNTTTSTIVLNGITQFDISKFKSPGHILLQGTSPYYVSSIFGEGNTTGYSYALFSYQTIVTDTTAVNKFTFTGVKDLYLSNAGLIKSRNDWGYFEFKTINGWFIETTSDGNIPLYPYYSPYLNGVYISNSSEVNEYWEQSPLVETIINLNHLPLTFKPHRKQSNIPVALFSSTGDHLFIGSNKITTQEYWDEYATLIVDRFNTEFQYRNIKAELSRGPGIGEIIVTYPDGYSIEILNGKYDATTNTVTYPGNHKFIPDIGKSQSTDSPVFTKLAVRNNNELNIKNEAYFSRRKIPEICSAGSFIQLGASDKKIIGHAQIADDLYIFKEDGIFRIIDNGNISTNIPNVSTFQVSVNLICQSGDSIQEINDEIIFLSQYGFISITNSQFINISESIQKDIITLTKTSPKYRIRSFVNESKNLYYCTLINELDSSLDVKSGTYIFNTKTRQWTFMSEEIIDGMEDSNGRNLVAYRQKPILAKKITGDMYSTNTTDYYSKPDGTNGQITYNIDNYEFSYPLQVSSKNKNFYYISREKHTNNIPYNGADQYDFITNVIDRTLIGYAQYSPATYSVNKITFTNIIDGNTVITQGISLYFVDTGYRNRNSTGYDRMSTLTYYVPRNNTLTRYPIGIYPVNQNNELTIVDSPLQFFVDKSIYAKCGLKDINNNISYVNIRLKLKAINYKHFADTPVPTIPTIPTSEYKFEFIDNVIPSNWTSDTLQSVQLLAGVPAKITFNPESGNQPDSNKLFQEYMIHTETSNKAMSMNFKTDSKQSFLTKDRRFEYDPNVTTRNVFRTYIPTSVSRGRYLIRQVKHDVPLENLIITGQTIVMRDSGSTRVQKDRDDT